MTFGVPLQMASSPLGEIEDLALCSYCKRPFDDGEQQPKVLSCKHHFCLRCVTTVLLKGRELYCVHCWKRTDLPELRPDALPTHAAVLALARQLSAGGLSTPNSGPAPTDSCSVHGLPLTLWCATCGSTVCRACTGQPEHTGHSIKPQGEACADLRADAQRNAAHVTKLLGELQQLVFKQRDFLLKILDACTTLKTQLEGELVNNLPGCEVSEAREALDKARRELAAAEAGGPGPAELHALATTLATERRRLQTRHREMFLQCKLDELVRNAAVVFDFELLRRALAAVHAGEPPPHTAPADNGYHSPVLFLANYCMSQLYSRHYLAKQLHSDQYNGHGLIEPRHPTGSYPSSVLANCYSDQVTNNNMATAKISPLGLCEGAGAGGGSSGAGGTTGGLSSPATGLHSPLLRNPSTHIYPVFYFNMEMNGSPLGRVLIEVRSDVAPRMARNFTVLATGELGVGYKGCSVFQCWENESIITGDFELNNGRGGRSVFEESYFMPDDTKMVAVRGSVGMRRSQKRHDNLGLVGSQFRIILREMRGFTAIFAFVVEGLELIDRISQSGDSAGKPQCAILIASCGKLN
ncbi:Peptidyl-prolyl cis-trans isomerase A1 [Eumeta japonica]|uniref:Peptidyl-prolyl cis-trans isomerase A1 n=1 Tax=Eumeta variegata TaxID=151549 RepID=A0A4C1XMM8_EUMVA|nr:Peptidyl-prolyl cis-trans isomerase A1 [Eumeta japonica]